MKRFLLLVFCTCALVAPSAQAEDYLRLEAALVSLSGYDDANAAGFAWGRDLPRQLPHMSAEVEFLKGFTKLRGSNSLSFSKTAAFAAFTYPADPRILAKGKVGLRYSTLDRSGKGGMNNDLGVDFGIGALYILDRTRRLTVDYISGNDNDFSQFILGLQFQI